MRYHTAGSYEEIIADGTKTTKVIGDNFEIIMRDQMFILVVLSI